MDLLSGAAWLLWILAGAEGWGSLLEPTEQLWAPGALTPSCLGLIGNQHVKDARERVPGCPASQSPPGAPVALRESSADEGDQREKQWSWGRPHGILEQPLTTISVTASRLNRVTFKGRMPAALQGWETTSRTQVTKRPAPGAALDQRFFLTKRPQQKYTFFPAWVHRTSKLAVHWRGRAERVREGGRQEPAAAVFMSLRAPGESFLKLLYN